MLFLESLIADGTEMGLKLIESQCDFIQHCRDNAATLSEHDWYAMITNLVPFQGGIAKVHALSKDYPAYTAQETDMFLRTFCSFKFTVYFLVILQHWFHISLFKMKLLLK